MQKDVVDYLTTHPDLVDAWIEWSENKRTGQGAFFTQTDQKFIVGQIDPDGKTVSSTTYNSKFIACADFIQKELIEIILSSGIERNYEKDFDLLIGASIEIGNLIEGKPIPQEVKNVYFAEGLGQKVINHALTIRYLFEGYQLGGLNALFEPKVDYSSIIVLTRAALETYLTLNYVFVAEEKEELKEFRFLCWDLAGYIERSKFQATTEDHSNLKQSEAQAIESLTNKIKENAVFKSLSPSEQKQALKGEWRLNYKWHDLATKAGFSIDYFRQQYKFLCSYAHASRLSVIQIQQNKSFNQQKDMATSAIGTMMVVLAKHMADYIEIMPQLKAIKTDMGKYGIIDFWKTIGEQLLQPTDERA